MTTDNILVALAVFYVTGWAFVIYVAMNTHIAKRTVVLDLMLSAGAAFWPIFLIWSYIYLASDRLARKFPDNGGKRNDDGPT